MFNEITKDVLEIAKAREPNLTPQSILKHAATEVVEATHAAAAETSWDTACELADIIICAIIVAGLLKVDLDKAFDHKMHVNAARAGITMPEARGATIV
jgi:NTP pyrophosphatase (non-canonical NTP hydrolase)